MSLIWTCPDHDLDLEDEGFAFWCPAGHPVLFDEDFGRDPDDEYDRICEERHARD